MTPDEYINFLEQYSNSSMGQRANASMDETASLNRKQLLGNLQNQRDQIAISRGVAEANAWYQRQQIKLAQKEHEDQVAKWLRDEGFRDLDFRTTATGMLEGQPTWMRQYQTAGLTGMIDGKPTWERMRDEAQLEGYYNGKPTFQREQAASDTALRAVGIGASLGGPRNWGKYIRGAGAVGSSPLLSNTPNLGMAADQGQQSPLTLAGIFSDYGQNGALSAPAAPAGATPTVAGQTDGNVGATGATATPGNPGGLNLANVLGGAVNAVSQTPSNASLGISDDEANVIRGYLRNPHTADPAWWASKDDTQKDFIRGLADVWGEDVGTFESKMQNARPNQGSVFAAA
jgi:hypothetical protein